MEWYCYYNYDKTPHEDGHEAAFDVYEDEWEINWTTCGGSTWSGSICWFNTWI